MDDTSNMAWEQIRADWEAAVRDDLTNENWADYYHRKVRPVDLDSPETKKRRVECDRDYVNCPEYLNSMELMLALYAKDAKKDKFADPTIRRILMVNQEELESIYQSALGKLRLSMVEGDYRG